MTVTSKSVSTAPARRRQWGNSGPAPFQRMWDLYLAYCQARFRAGYLDVHQLLLERVW